MNLRGLDLNLLIVLDALLTEKNVSRAAERVCLSQSATSGALGRLRTFFRDELLVQIGRQMVLTPLAQNLATPVRSILLQVQTTIAMKAEFDPATSDRKFSIMASDYVMLVLLTEVLRRSEIEAPGITVELRGTATPAGEALERGEVDFLILPEIFISGTQPRQVLFEDNFTCVVWNGNAIVGEQLSFEQYLEMGHVVVELGEEHQPSFEEWFLQTYGYTRRIEVIAPSFNLAPALVIGTNRIATVHTRLARLCAKYLPLRLIPFPTQIPKLIEMLQWHQYQDKDPGSIWLRGLLKEASIQLDAPTA